jgi:uncharacterized protein (UPF0548 family)
MMMFSTRPPTESLIRRQLETARNLPCSYTVALDTRNGLENLQVPKGYVVDHTRSEIGGGLSDFETAKSALRQWQHFDLGWVRVVNPEVPIAPGEVVAVEVRALGFWSLNLSRILYVIDEPNRFGFAYGTTPLHAERGEERFLLEYDPTPAISPTTCSRFPNRPIRSQNSPTPTPAACSTGSPPTP